jgi:hypothetical protein
MPCAVCRVPCGVPLGRPPALGQRPCRLPRLRRLQLCRHVPCVQQRKRWQWQWWWQWQWQGLGLRAAAKAQRRAPCGSRWQQVVCGQNPVWNAWNVGRGYRLAKPLKLSHPPPSLPMHQDNPWSARAPRAGVPTRMAKSTQGVRSSTLWPGFII